MSRALQCLNEFKLSSTVWAREGYAARSRVMRLKCRLTCRNHRFKVKQDGVTRSAADMLAYQGVTLDQLEAVMKKHGVVPGALWWRVQ